MLEFIVVNKIPFKEIIISEIEKCMNDFNKIYNQDYKIKKFENYNQTFRNYIKKSSKKKKIFILKMSDNTPEDKCSILRQIKNNFTNSEIIVTCLNNKEDIIGLSAYTFKIMEENQTNKLRDQIYETIKDLNTYNENLLKLNIIENNILHIIDIDDIYYIEHIGKTLLIETKYYSINSYLNYEYLKNKLPNNFKDIGGLKLINTDYIDEKKYISNVIEVSAHKRIRHKKDFIIEKVRQYENGILTLQDIEKYNINKVTFNRWLKKYGNNKKINIDVKVETN